MLLRQERIALLLLCIVTSAVLAASAILTNIDKAEVRPAHVEKAMRLGRATHPLITSGFIEIKPVANSRTREVEALMIVAEARVF